MNIIRIGKSNRLQAKKILIVFVVLVSIVFAFFRGTYVNTYKIEEQLQHNIGDVAGQNAEILRTKIQKQYDLICSLSKKLEDCTPGNIQERLDGFTYFINGFQLKRFAFSFPDGTTYSTDGQISDLSYRDFFKKGMDGQSCITAPLKDALRGEHTLVNIMTIPVYDNEGAIHGVFGVAYDTVKFNQSMQINCFDGKGNSCIITETGELMSVWGEEDATLSENFFETARAMDGRNEEVIDELQQNVKQGKTSSGALFISDKQYYYSVPVKMMGGCVTWHILTMVPSTVLDERMEPIQKNQGKMYIGMIVLVVAGMVLLIRMMNVQYREMLGIAYEDTLTKGPNAAKFWMEAKKRWHSNDGYMVVMDIANFNNISVVAGDASGNAMITETWDIIRRTIDKEEVAGHVRDDMFLLYLRASDEESLIRKLEKISDEITQKAKDVRVYGVKAGYGICPISEEETVETAYSKAKLAREYALSKTKLHYAFYDELNRKQMQYEKELEENFSTALREEMLEVWYQPKYSASTCAVVGSEALVRWRKRNGQLIPPGDFIPLFERNGMIMQLDEYVFQSVCRQQREWKDAGKSVYPVSINISRASLYCTDIEQRYRKIMEQYQVSPEWIQLEITETVLGSGENVGKILNDFRNIGVKILMDDFGTGYSSLNTLNNQWFDTLKLDKTLIDHIGDEVGETLLHHVIQMGQSMGLHITAEGVEKRTQLTFLQDMKCDDIQGFYFSRPLEMKEYEKMLDEEREK